IAGQLGIDHAMAIHDLGVRDCGRLLVPRTLKSELLDRLDAMGINAHSLQIGDSTVETLAGDVMDTIKGL
ncbi:MAG TPA: hypothetical protein VMV81_07650, partial [Phycisphaerae bacterium]|nr:hypothetical protein [Phycisphaerae bacterium]